MFWSKKKKHTNKAAQKKAELRRDAMANMKAARENIGEETLDRIASAIAKKQHSAMEQAKDDIHNADAERVAAEILSMIETRH